MAFFKCHVFNIAASRGRNRTKGICESTRSLLAVMGDF